MTLFLFEIVGLGEGLGLGEAASAPESFFWGSGEGFVVGVAFASLTEFDGVGAGHTLSVSLGVAAGVTREDGVPFVSRRTAGKE